MFGRLFGRKGKEEKEQKAPEEVPVSATPPEHTQFIERCLAHAVKIGEDYGEVLDYSPASIQAVGRILDSYHQRYLRDQGQMGEKLDAFASVFGVYIGEALLRAHPDAGYGWVGKPQFGLVVGKGEGYHIDVIAKVTKQIVNGREEGDEVVSFFRVAEQLMEGNLQLPKK